MERMKKLLILIPLVLLGLFFLLKPANQVQPDPQPDPAPVTDPVTQPVTAPEPESGIAEDGIYDSKDDVALYLYTYHHLPSNYMTKKEARKLGWDDGPLNKVIEGKCIGGDVFGNREGLLPEISSKYYECEIDTLTADDRGEKRLVWSEDFDIYYTDDYFHSFVKLYDGSGGTASAAQPEADPVPAPVPEQKPETDISLAEDGVYDTADEVALYLVTYHHLPSNFMTKKEARKIGWSSGALNQVAEGKCIGGDVYGNYEGVLPDISGNYYECDIGTINSRKRGEKRLVWSDDFDVYYTEDHYETFVQLYGD